jgi:hypothetical protein
LRWISPETTWFFPVATKVEIPTWPISPLAQHSTGELKARHALSLQLGAKGLLPLTFFGRIIKTKGDKGYPDSVMASR